LPTGHQGKSQNVSDAKAQKSLTRKKERKLNFHSSGSPENECAGGGSNQKATELTSQLTNFDLD
jgi:hypothetical protein